MGNDKNCQSSPLRSLRLGVRKNVFKPGWARWVGEESWHESQKAKKNGDESLELSFRVAGLDEIKSWILSFSLECQVLEPEKLKEMVRKGLSRNLAQYSKPPVSLNSMGEMILRSIPLGITC